jgi:hypothetical protein
LYSEQGGVENAERQEIQEKPCFIREGWQESSPDQKAQGPLAVPVNGQANEHSFWGRLWCSALSARRNLPEKAGRMSTTKLIVIIAIAVFILFGAIGICIASGSKDSTSPVSIKPVTAGDRLSAVEDQINDLSRQLQTAEQQNDNLEKSVSDLNAKISHLEREIVKLQEELR